MKKVNNEIKVLRNLMYEVNKQVDNLSDPRLVEDMIIGDKTGTEICIVYIQHVADEKIVDEVKRRLQSIQIDAVLESGYVEELIEDAPFSIFSTISNTESPDKLAGKLLEGRVGIMFNGTPFALSVPMLFVEHFQVREDYYSRAYLVSFIRFFRFVAIHVSIFLPAFWVAIATFHTAILPTTLLVKVAASREGMPFPTAIEAILILLIFEGLKEAGVRLPRPIGPSVSIIGGIILGDAAVSAGIASPIMIIVVGVTGVTGFVIPPQADSITILRIPILIMASIFGIVGITWCYVFLIVHLVSLRSFGTPYFSPFAPLSWKGLKDTFVRVPWWMMGTRPDAISWQTSRRESDSNKPKPPAKK